MDDTSKVKSFEGALIPREIIEAVYFADELAAINELMEQSAALEAELDEMREEESGDEGLLKDVMNDKGDSIPKANLNKRLKELDAKKTSAVMDAITRYGTAAFPGGRKVYISRRLWNRGVTVMGLNRYMSRYDIETVPLAWIENIRVSKTFGSKVLELMTNTDEFPDMWWRYKEEDKIGATEYAQILNRVKAGDKEAFDQYNRDVMERFYHF